MKRFLYFILLLAAEYCMPVTSPVFAQQATFKASLSDSIEFDQSTTYTVNLLRKNLVYALSKASTISLTANREMLMIQPDITLSSKDITATAPPLIAMNIDLGVSLVNRKDGTVFHTTSIPLKGVGKTENKAYSNAFNRIRYQAKALDNFMLEASSKVVQYYDNNCDMIIAEASRLRKLLDYDGAMQQLHEIPAIATGCYKKAEPILTDIYKQSQSQDCQKLLNIAETAIALRNYEEASQTLVQIDPATKCFAKVQGLKDRISEATGDQYERVWEYEHKRLEVSGGVLAAKYESLPSGSASFTSISGSSGSYGNGGGGGGNVNIVNNNVGGQINNGATKGIGASPASSNAGTAKPTSSATTKGSFKSHCPSYPQFIWRNLDIQ